MAAVTKPLTAWQVPLINTILTLLLQAGVASILVPAQHRRHLGRYRAQMDDGRLLGCHHVTLGVARVHPRHVGVSVPDNGEWSTVRR